MERCAGSRGSAEAASTFVAFEPAQVGPYLLIAGRRAVGELLAQIGPLRIAQINDDREAKQCLSVAASRQWLWRVEQLQCAAVEQGAPTGRDWPLWRPIEWLDENRKITIDQRRWADVARWVGNNGAHNTEPAVAEGSPVIIGVSENDARDAIKLVEHLFETIYLAKKVADEHHARLRL